MSRNILSMLSTGSKRSVIIARNARFQRHRVILNSAGPQDLQIPNHTDSSVYEIILECDFFALFVQYCSMHDYHHSFRTMETVDIQAVESKLTDVTVTAIPMITKTSNIIQPQPANTKQDPNLSKYAQLLGVIEEMGREVRPTYAGSRSSAERLKRNIVSARILVRECLIETERSARQ